eukprot:2839524-Pleurochrysis_carterae.AAC.1
MAPARAGAADFSDAAPKALIASLEPRSMLREERFIATKPSDGGRRQKLYASRLEIILRQ